MAADNSDGSALKPYQFQPGQSGNPGGKSPERERLRRLLLAEYGEGSIKGIVEIAKDKQVAIKVRLDALKWIAEQCIGKARQEVTGPNGEPVRFDGDIRGILADILAGKGR